MLRDMARGAAGWNAPADDLFQECRVAVVAAYPRWDVRLASWRTYAFAHARCAIRRYFRDRSALIRKPAWRWELGDRAALCCVSVDAQRVAEPSEDPRAVIESALYVESLLAPLPERERDVMRLVSEGVGPAEIAAALGLHKETVGRLRAQAVVRLRRKMRAAGAGEGRE